MLYILKLFILNYGLFPKGVMNNAFKSKISKLDSFPQHM